MWLCKGLQQRLNKEINHFKHKRHFVFCKSKVTMNMNYPVTMVLMLLFQAAKKVVQFVSSQHRVIQTNMDGKNVEAVLLELGTRLHRTIYDHLTQFTYNSLGNSSSYYVLLCSPKKFPGSIQSPPCPSVCQSVSPSVRPNRVRPITSLFEVRFRNYFTEMITILRRSVAYNIWVATFKVKVTA